MKNRLLSLLTISSLVASFLISFPQKQYAKDKADISALAYLLPESNIIMAMDMDRTLNFVGPSLLGNDDSKIENLRKLAKSAENTIGIDPYQVNQVVVGINFESDKPISFFDDVHFTVLLRTKDSNEKLIENWVANLDKIDAFKEESKPAKRYVDGLRRLRNYQISESQRKKLKKLIKKFDEFNKKTAKTERLLLSLPRAAKIRADYKKSLRLNKSFSVMTRDFQKILQKDTDTKALNKAIVKIQNRLYLLDINDPNRKNKLKNILADAKLVYPIFKAKIEEARFTGALIDFSRWEFYEEFSKAEFGEYEADISQTPTEVIETRLDAVIKSLSELPKTRIKRNRELAGISKNYRALDKAMKIYLGALDDISPIRDISKTSPPKAKKKESMSEALKKHAKFSLVNGKRLITIDESKIDLFQDSVIPPPPPPVLDDTKDSKNETDKTTDGDKKETSKERKAPPEIVVVKKPKSEKDRAKEATKEAADKAKEAVEEDSPRRLSVTTYDPKPVEPRIFAVGFLDKETIAFGYEKEIREILTRESSYKNTRAAEMIESFKSPLISFAISSDLISKFMGAFSSPGILNENEEDSHEDESEKPKNEDSTKDEETDGKEKDEKETEKELSQSEKFLKDLNIFGAVEYDDANSATQDIILSLGFTKNKVEEVFKEEPPKDGGVLELGDFRIFTNMLYDLVNSLKVFKASLGFKFEKKKVAEIIEKTPDLLRKAQIEPKPPSSKKKTRIRSISDIKKLLEDPSFYSELLKSVSN